MSQEEAFPTPPDLAAALTDAGERDVFAQALNPAEWTEETFVTTRIPPEHVFIITGATTEGATLAAALLIATEGHAADEDGVYRREAHILLMRDSLEGLVNPLEAIIVPHVPHATQQYNGARFCWLWPYEARRDFPKNPITRDANMRTEEQVRRRDETLARRALNEK